MEKAIYKITNKINGKSYIGQSVTPKRRFARYIRGPSDKEGKSLIHNAIEKYGKENFIFEVLEWTEDYNNREKELIVEHNTIAPNGYNILPGGEDPPHYYGEDHSNSVVTEKQVDIIIQMLKERELTEPKIGEMFDPPLNQTLIHNINWGITHKRDNEKYPIRETCPYWLTEEQVEEVKWLLKNSLFPCYQIAEHYHVDTSSIKAINIGRNHKDDNDDYPIRKFRGRKQSEPVETILAKRSTATIDT